MKNFKQRIGLTFITAMAFVFISSTVTAQYNYQAVVRNADGDLITNTAISVRVSLIRDIDGGNDVTDYRELHSATTNSNGLISLVIGNGVVDHGALSNVDWSGYNDGATSDTWKYRVKAEYDLEGGTAYTIVTEDEIRDVPRASYADNAGKAKSADNGAIAYGFVSEDATVVKGKGIESVVWSASYSRYEIELTDINYFYTNYATVVTATDNSRITSVGSVGGKLLIHITNLSGVSVQSPFQFVTYDL